MPGLFGSVGCPLSGYERMRSYYADAWEEEALDELASEHSMIGGHAFGRARATYRTREHHVGMDGDVQSYRAVRRWADEASEPVLAPADGFMELHAQITGTAVAVQRRSGTLFMARDWAGSFPMYYAEWEGGLVFANLLRPLARVVGHDLDRLGVIQYLRQGYIFGNRTPFRSVRRLRPGETLRFDPEAGRLSTEDRSELWVGESGQTDDDPVDRCLGHLQRSFRSTFQVSDAPALMMSGGWDSRTLLGVGGGPNDDRAPASLLGFSHGDVESRELRLVRRLCDEVGVPCRLEPIDGRIFDVAAHGRDFARTGISLFPHWHRSGHVLADNGHDAAMAGIFGEVLGGHYGRTMAASGLEKLTSFLRQSRSSPGAPSHGDAVDVALEALRIEDVGSDDHWYLDSEFERSIHDKKGRINEEIRRALDRFLHRGVRTPDRLIEACITEHRGSQYIAGQTASLRTAVDVSLPFADRSLLHVASRMAPHVKVHNAINRGMLQAVDGSLLGYPLAATLAPASAPILMQEASRLVRKVWEAVGWRCYFASRGASNPPRFGWVNFEFLRESPAFERVVESLTSDLWDVSAIRSRLRRAQRGEYGNRLHPLFDQLGKLHTIDRLLA